MAEKKIYIGSVGPFLYDDEDDINDADGDFAGETMQSLRSDGGLAVDGDFSVGGDLDVTGDVDIGGTAIVGSLKLDDTDDSNTLEIIWNEDDSADRVLNLLVAGADRSLTVELDSVLNQDLTTDAEVTFAKVNALTLAAVTVGFTIAGGTTSKTLTVDDNFVVSTQLAAIGANTDKVTESTTVTSPLVLTDYDISIPAATNAAAGHATAAHIQAIEANTLKNTNVSTALEVGTVGVNTVAITSDGGADDVTLPAATVTTAGMLTTAKWAEIVANTTKVTCNFANVQTALAAASGAVAFNSQNLTGVGTIGCGTITTTGNIVLPANGVIGVTDGNPQIVFDNANNWLEITGNVGIGGSPTTNLDIQGTGTVSFRAYSSDGQANFNVQSSTASGTFYASPATSSVRIYNTKDIVSFETSGRVGVGTSTPDYMLDVYGSTVDTGLRVRAGTAGTEAASLYLSSNLTRGWILTAGAYVAGTNSYDLTITQNGYQGNLALMDGSQVGKVGIGLALTNIAAKLHVDQSSTTAAIPVLILDQADESEGTINFIASARGVISGATDSTESVRVELNGTVYRLALYADA